MLDPGIDHLSAVLTIDEVHKYGFSHLDNQSGPLLTISTGQVARS
jgi:hypothetical protein